MHTETRPLNPQLSSSQFWLLSHLRAILFSFGELVRNPLASLMTLAVIGVAMALPAGLYMMLQNFQGFSANWNSTPTISLYMQKNVSNVQLRQVEEQLNKIPDIGRVRYVSPQQGLKEFEQTTQLGNSLSELKANPLPSVFVVYPEANYQTPADLEKLLTSLKRLPGVDVGQLDMAWIKRLYYILEIGKRVIYTMALLFGIGVILIVGNTIRLAMQNHRNEITVLRLVGAKPAFIRRPLLYRGLFYGLFGGAIAWALVGLMQWWLEGPALALATTYDNSLEIHGLNITTALLIMTLCAALGWLGSYFAVNKHLRTPEEA